MRSIKINCFICLLGIVFFISCKKDNSSSNTSDLYIPSAADVTPIATLAELQQGRDLYINNCGSCHSFYSPDSYTPASWNMIMPNMGPKTNLNYTQLTLVTKYVCRGKQ